MLGVVSPTLLPCFLQALQTDLTLPQQVPGVLHAWYIIAKFPEHDYESVDESERGGRVAYVVVRDDDPRRTPRPTPRPSGRSQPKPPPRQADMTYGTNGTNGAGANPHDAGSSSNAAAGPSEGAPPPSYAQAVSGDHKIQDQS